MSAAGFLQAICEEPDEDVHRLVYADWLDDHGDPDRAEFIRLQCALAKLEEDDPAAEGLRRREAELLREHQEQWRGTLPDLPEVHWAYDFRRGFIEAAEVRTYTAWRSQGLAILRATPLALLSIQQIRPSPLRRLARSPGIECVRGLEFPMGYFEDGDLEVLARACRLREFSYSANSLRTTLGPDARHIFATMPAFAGLRRLWLHNVPFGNGGAARLPGAPNMTELVSLRLSRCEVTSLGAIALAAPSNWGCLRSLDLSRNFIRDDGCRAIASSPGLGELRELILSDNNISSAGMVALARSMFLSRLRNLDLSGTTVGDDGVEALATSTNLQTLRSLNLEQTNVSAAGALQLLRSPLAANLHWLNLRGIEIAPAFAMAIEEMPGLDSLQKIFLSHCPEEDRLRKRFGDRVEFL